MPPRIWTIRISDIMESIDKILKYTAGMKYEDFSEDSKTIDAVIRNFIIIGEAANHLPENITEAYPEIPWQDIEPKGAS